MEFVLPVVLMGVYDELGAVAPKRICPFAFTTNWVKFVPPKLNVNPMFWAAELPSSDPTRKAVPVIAV
jgi:hypothetical protein